MSDNRDKELYTGKDAEARVAVDEVDTERLTGWKARVRKAEKVLGIEAQGIKRVHECTHSILACFAEY